MARRLAAEVGYRYIDSGAMYRAVTLWAMRNGMITADNKIDVEALSNSLSQIDIDFEVTPDGQRTILNGDNVESEIRSMPVSSHVSAVATLSPVRKALTAMQQALGAKKGIVMDGRDIGTTVFPDAELKIFVDASAETRARRRLLELQSKGESGLTYEEVLANITERDKIDITREESPLRCAVDAVRFDNSGMSLYEQDRLLLKLFKERTSQVK